MAGRDLNYRITVDAASGTAGIRDFSRAVTREMKAVDQSLDETGSNAGRVARALGQLADAAETELKSAAAAADALGQALGPELAASMGRDGIAEKVGDLNRMGLTFEEIEADAEELAAAIKRIDDVQVSAASQGLSNVGGKLREVRGEAEQSRSVMANMVGNSTQDLAALGGVAGSAGVALGQLGEYATEGGISLKGLAGVAGPMLGVALAVQAINTKLEKTRQIDAFNEQRVEDYFDAIRDGTGWVSKLADELADTGEIAVAVSDVFGMMSGKNLDLAAGLRAFGLELADFERLVEAGPATITAWGDAQLATGAKALDVEVMVAALRQEYDNLEAAEQRNITTNEVLGSSAVDLAGGIFEVVSAADEAAIATQEMADRAENLERKWSNLKDELSERSAFLDVKDAFDEVHTTAYNAWVAAETGADNAEEAARAHERAVLNLKGTVADYATEVGNISPRQVTDIYADIDEGSVDNAERELEGLEADRHVSIFARLMNNPLGGLGKPAAGATAAPTRTLRAVPDVPAPPAAVPAASGMLVLDVAAPAAAVTPVTVDLRGAVVGSRYDVVRTVRDAVRDGVRLAGSR